MNSQQKLYFLHPKKKKYFWNILQLKNNMLYFPLVARIPYGNIGSEITPKESQTC